MAENRTRPLALTMGEPAGVGGEITLAAWRALRERGPAFFVLDDPGRLEALARKLAWDVPIAAIAEPSDTASRFASALPVLPITLEASVLPGEADRRNAPAVIGAIERAVRYTLSGAARAVVTNPINKAALYAAGFAYPGHTEFLAALTGRKRPVMMLLSREFRVVPVTVHMALRRAIEALTTTLIIETARITAEALSRDFGIETPRLAFSGLNPHAGEGGALGTEDRDIVAPAIAALQRAGISASGPFPADTMFTPRARAHYDAAICMYHDQALIPLKTLAMDEGVNVTLGLPIVRTSPDHGTAFDIAGKGVADPSSLIAALELAGAIAVERERHA